VEGTLWHPWCPYKSIEHISYKFKIQIQSCSKFTNLIKFHFVEKLQFLLLCKWCHIKIIFRKITSRNIFVEFLLILTNGLMQLKIQTDSKIWFCQNLKFKFEEHLELLNVKCKFKWKCVAFMMPYIYFCIAVCFSFPFQFEFIWFQSKFIET
jgi:hypothetical protein